MEKQDACPVHDYIAGALAGSAGVIAGHPFDTVKVQLQIDPREKVASLKNSYIAVKSQNISHGFFRGLSWPLLSYGIINSVFFGVYGNTLTLLDADITGKTTPDYSKIILAGSLGGVAQLIPACPIDVIKVVLQSQIPHERSNFQTKYYKGPLEGAADILRNSGIKGMYRGLPSQLLRDVPASAAYFLIFEFLSFNGTKKFSNNFSMLQNFLYGGIAGVLSWALIIPFDVMKSRIQADSDRKFYTGIIDCAIKSYKESGIKIFFRGLSLTSMRAFPVNGVTLMMHTEIMKFFGQQRYQDS